jgi:fructokinase
MTVLVVGESLVDVVTSADGSVVERPGGSPLNVAVGLGRLGLPVRLVTALADDPHGLMLQQHLAASKVELERHPLPATAVAQARLDADGAATYDFALRWELGAVALPEALTWLHVGSLGVTQQPGAGAVAELVERVRGQVPVSYDPNCRPALMGGPAAALGLVEEQVRRSDVVKLSEEDARWLCPGEPLDVLAQRWLALGPAVVVVTAGAAGAQAWTSADHVRVEAVQGPPVVDTVGAGDAFTAGLVWCFAGRDPRQVGRDELVGALGAASRVARLTCARPGADPPWRHEL